MNGPHGELLMAVFERLGNVLASVRGFLRQARTLMCRATTPIHSSTTEVVELHFVQIMWRLTRSSY